jgi:predicted transcriptional regulator
MRTLRIQLSDELEQKLEHEARTTRRESSAVACEAIAVYLHRRRLSFKSELIRAAQAVGQDPDSLEITEEFLPLDNEALDLAERSNSMEQDSGKRGHGR